MLESQPQPFEQALLNIEQDAEAALKSAAKVVKGLKGLKQAAQLGEVRKLEAAIQTIQQSIKVLDQEVSNVATDWVFDEESYLREGGFSKELLALAASQGLLISQRENRLYSYPVLMALDPARRAVLIDRRPERRIRPSVLVRLLQGLQDRPPRFKPAAFLESLYTAYTAVFNQRKDRLQPGAVLPLLDLYALFTMLPDEEKEYTRQEFARDVYLLDISEGVTTTRDGATMALHASTSTRSGRGVLSIVTQQGAEKRYFGISFSKIRGN